MTVQDEYEGLDMQQVTWLWHAHDFIGQALAMYDQNLNLVPAQAERFVIGDNGTSFTFYLPHDAKFSNGDALNASAIKASLERYMRVSPYGSSISDRVTSIEIIDAYTVKYVMNSPVIGMFVEIAEASGGPVDAAVADKVGNETFNLQPVSNGAWMVKEWVRGSHLVLEKNPYYKTNLPYVKNKGPNPNLDEVIIRFIPEGLTRVSEFEAGNVDILFDIPGESIPALRNDPTVNLGEVNMPQVQWVVLNSAKPGLNDVNVRQAIMYAINRSEVVIAADQVVSPLYTFTTSGMFFGNKTLEQWAATQYAYNEQKAKDLLSQAGWVDSNGDGVLEKGANSLKFEILIRSGTKDEKIAAVLQAQLRKVGIQIDIKLLQSSYIREQLVAGTFDMTIRGFGWVDPNDISYWVHSGWTELKLGYNNPEVEVLLDRARVGSTVQERTSLYTQVNLKLFDDMPLVPLYIDKAFYATHKNLKGLVVLPPWVQFLFNDVTIEK